jgi:ATP-dependent DNA helicase 2 subunit 2
LLLLDRKGTVERVPTRSESKLNITHMPTPSPRKKALARSNDDSGTEEDENDEELLLDLKKPTHTSTLVPPGEVKPLPTPARSLSPSIIDPGRAPGRIIGNTYPLKDFKKNIAQGDVVTKAVQDLAEVIVEVVLKPFATRRRGEMIECMTILRKTCLEVCMKFAVQLLVADVADFRRMRLTHGMRSSVI